jgi:GTP-binding protein HflX
LRAHFPEALFISVQTGAGIEALVARISDFVSNGICTVAMQVPASRADVVARIHREGNLIQIEYDDCAAHIIAALPKRTVDALGEFIVAPTPGLEEGKRSAEPKPCAE